MPDLRAEQAAMRARQMRARRKKKSAQRERRRLMSPENLLNLHLESTFSAVLHIVLYGAVAIFAAVGLYLRHKRIG